MSSQVNLKHCTACMIYTYCPYHTAWLFSSGGYCSLQPTAQPVIEQVSSFVKSESEWKWARMLDISNCVLTMSGDLIWISSSSAAQRRLFPAAASVYFLYAAAAANPTEKTVKMTLNAVNETLTKIHGWRGWTKSLTCICSLDEVHLDILDFLYVLHIIRVCVIF